MWNHNSHYHSYLLRQIPKRVYRALDVGCGLGLFAWKLAERSEIVDAMDVDSAVLAEASILNPAPNISYLKADFLAVDLPQADYDVVVSLDRSMHLQVNSQSWGISRL
jgi:2-polyprenyl-3-methyl-5-hydroxy-6-metoxy-1,4-benzoquinol methylase